MRILIKITEYSPGSHGAIHPFIAIAEDAKFPLDISNLPNCLRRPIRKHNSLPSPLLGDIRGQPSLYLTLNEPDIEQIGSHQIHPFSCITVVRKGCAASCAR